MKIVPSRFVALDVPKAETALQLVEQLASVVGAFKVGKELFVSAGLRQFIPPEVQLVTPGIRLPDAKKDDQKRTLSPREALAAGANWLVIGRPICAAANPRAAAEEILASLRQV